MPLQHRKPSSAASAGNSITEVAKEIEERVEKAILLLWDELPSWQQDNHYIRSGYRRESRSYRESFASLGYLHNESVNIYSHLLGAIAFTCLGVILNSILGPRYVSASTSNVLAFACFFLGAF